MDRDRSEWTSACSAHLQIEGKSNHITHVGLSKTLASSKLGVPDVLANLLGLLAEIPKYCVLGFCVALVIKKTACAQSLQKIGRVMSEFPLFWFNIEAFRTIPMVGHSSLREAPRTHPKSDSFRRQRNYKRDLQICPCLRHSFRLSFGIGQLTRKEAS